MRRLIAEHIDSVEQLEILLLLYQHPERSWSEESVARELRISPMSAGDRLKDMARAAILSKVQGTEGEYRYTPDAQMGEAVAGLAAAYSERRVTVINLIFSKPVDKIRTFADAFRLRRDDDDDNG